VLKTAVLAALLAAPAFGAQVETAPAPMTPALLGNIQMFLATPTGLKLAGVDPSLGAIRDLSAKSDLHLAALGGLAAQLDPGKPLTAGALLSANEDSATAARIATILNSRVEEVKSRDTMTPSQKKNAAAQLSAIADLAEGYADKKLAKAAAAARKLAAALAPESPDAHTGKIKWIDVLDLRPMQFDVEKKKNALLKMTPAQRRAWLLDHPVPVVVRENGDHRVHKGGPQSERNRKQDRPDDHHHEARAAWEAGIEMIPVVIEKSTTDGKSEKKFWKRMRKTGKVYLKDRWGNAHDERDLPLDIRGLGDNPYRSIAGEVRDRGGYKKNHAPFSEFLWAEYFRENLTVHPNDDFAAAVKEAMVLARDKRARKLPGYIGKK